MQLDLTILIPAYNEQKNLALHLPIICDQARLACKNCQQKMYPTQQNE